MYAKRSSIVHRQQMKIKIKSHNFAILWIGNFQDDFFGARDSWDDKLYSTGFFRIFYGYNFKTLSNPPNPGRGAIKYFSPAPVIQEYIESWAQRQKLLPWCARKTSLRNPLYIILCLALSILTERVIFLSRSVAGFTMWRANNAFYRHLIKFIDFYPP